MISNELLKGAVQDVDWKIKIIDTEIDELLEEVNLLMNGIEDGAIKNFLNLMRGQLKHTSDVSIVETLNSLVELEAGIDMNVEEVTLGKLPGLTKQDIEDEDGEIIQVDPKPTQKRGRRKKTETLDDIFNDKEFMKVQ